jgi:hypothetical protein
MSEDSGAPEPERSDDSPVPAATSDVDVEARENNALLEQAAVRAQRARRAVVLLGIAIQVLSFAPGVADAAPYRIARFAVWIVAFGFTVTEGRKFSAASMSPWRSHALGVLYLAVAIVPQVTRVMKP